MPETATVQGVRVVLADLNGQIDSLVAGFQSTLAEMVAEAQAAVLADLQRRLAINDGMVAPIPSNVAVLQRVQRLLLDAMDKAGYRALLTEFVAGFNGSLPLFDELLDAISSSLKTPLKVVWTGPDLAAFEAQQIGSIDALRSVVESAATAVKRNAAGSIGALPFRDLTSQIVSTFGRSVPESTGLAETSQAMFFRTVTDRGFRQIEEGLPPGAIRYRYEGPDDKLTRPFCKDLLARTKKTPLTREQIDALDNGTSLSDVFTAGGGWRCRHTFLIAEIEKPPQKKRTKAA